MENEISYDSKNAKLMQHPKKLASFQHNVIWDPKLYYMAKNYFTLNMFEQWQYREYETEKRRCKILAKQISFYSSA